MLKHSELLYFDIFFCKTVSFGSFVAVTLLYLQSPCPNSLAFVQTSASPHPCGVYSFGKLLQSVSRLPKAAPCMSLGWVALVPVTSLLMLLPVVHSTQVPSLTLCLVPVFLSLRGVLHPAIPAAQLPAGLPRPGNTSTPGGGMEGE